MCKNPLRSTTKEIPGICCVNSSVIELCCLSLFFDMTGTCLEGTQGFCYFECVTTPTLAALLVTLLTSVGLCATGNNDWISVAVKLIIIAEKNYVLISGNFLQRPTYDLKQQQQMLTAQDAYEEITELVS